MHAGELDEKKKQATTAHRFILAPNQDEKVRRNGQIWRLCSSEMKQPIIIRSKADQTIDFPALDPTFWSLSDKFEF